MKFYSNFKKMKKIITIVFILLLNLFPYYGRSYFRYTGVNPDEKVLNLGTPIASIVIDFNTSPYLFIGPLYPFLFFINFVIIIFFIFLKIRKK